ncbi:MAG TPA: carboxypeptidase-like regulatory domain-containing protein [Thermoanaerobaculia bacterium]|nr:carboxypeptidase-like regulatory domain-containing protein [Thermoanaerobaculia bacterium]
MAQSGRQPPTSGYVSFALHTRAFDAPLFGSTTSTTLYLHAGQRFVDGSYWTTSYYRGFPLIQSLFTIEGERVPWRDGLAAIRAGEVTLQPIGDAGGADAYTIEGVAARWQRRNEEWMAYAGDTRYPTVLPGLGQSAPRLGGIEYRRRFGNASAGGAIIALGDATSPDHDSVRTVVRGDYDYALSPSTQLFSRAFVAGNGSTGFRIGSRFADFRHELTASIFSFDEDFPLVYPLFRPGERGGELYGSWRVTELSRVYGAVTYLSSDRLLGRSNLRGHLGYAFAAGSDAPHFDVSYHRDEITHDVLSTTRQDIIADRFSFGITRSSLAESLAVRLDHVMRNDHPQRTQLLVSYARVVGLESTVDSSVVAQKEDSTLGLTAEGVYEKPIRWPYSVRVGAGAALIHEEVEDRGEGIARLGLSRRFVGQLSGWYAQVEARASFPIGLPRSNLSSNTITIGLGNRLGWNDLGHARSVFTALVSPSDFGAVEGRVQLDGKGLANVPIVIQGQRAGVTGRDGRYRVSRVRAGIVSVMIDTSVLEQGFVVDGPESRSVLVAPRGVAQADFAITRRVALAGSLARCKDGQFLPLRGARIAMLGDQFVQTAVTSSSGGFEFDAVPPGTYELVIDPASVPEVSPASIPRRQVELTTDMLGYAILIDCNPAGQAPPPP